ncbi:MAG: hypothetical protein PQ612_06005 [Rickettsiales bacterium]|nr:hypothetical protein [Pseudomonadota bacterium]MDA0966877.1 hypothetical protein [Pseudomonadota bacterium]MDG4543552.1 hypothetical protein [Rickettsiales bacterium]MDG4545700.1 hypothetical protein [Rickettsiales bacterium]MDG4547527.1 hypothetical protein [Rickettsiales bacterium]
MSNTKVYMEQGGNKQVVAAGGEINIETGGALKINGTDVSSELAEAAGKATNVTFSYAAAAANVSEVTITVKNAAGTTIESPHSLDVYLSDAATGAGLTATTASGTVTAKAASGTVLGTLTAKKALRVQTLATGVFILEITDTAKTGFYPVVSLPNTGETIVGSQMVTGDYGA